MIATKSFSIAFNVMIVSSC